MGDFNEFIEINDSEMYPAQKIKNPCCSGFVFNPELNIFRICNPVLPGHISIGTSQRPIRLAR